MIFSSGVVAFVCLGLGLVCWLFVWFGGIFGFWFGVFFPPLQFFFFFFFSKWPSAESSFHSLKSGQ